MGLLNRITGVTNANAAAVPATTGRQINVLSFEILNPSTSNVVVDVKDGTTIKGSYPVPALGAVIITRGENGFFGLLLTAGNAFQVATRAAAGTIEVNTEYGRV